MALPVLPRAQGPIAGQLPTTIEWYNFFRDLRAFVVDNDGDIAQIDDILSRLTALENEEETFAVIQGLVSVNVFGSLESGLVQVQLQGDVASPGNTYYYGTGPTGVKGWSTISSAFTNGDGIDLVTGANGVTNISFNAATGEVASLPGATYKTVQKTIDVMFSPGIITGGEVTELTSTSVRINGGTAIVRISDDNVSELRFFNFAAQDFSVPDVQVTHFYAIDYNGGSPTIIESTGSESWDRDTQLPLGSAFRADGFLNVTANPYRVGDVVTNLIQRLDAIGPVQRDNSVGGLAIGEAGTRNVTVSAGRLWSRVSDFSITSKNSSVNTMASAYFNGVNVTVTSGITQWDNLNFNNLGTGSLQVLGNNKYANLWFFMSFNGTRYGFAYGTNEYNTLGDAANEGVPPYLTQNFFNQFILLGRFIFQKSAATTSLIESSFVTPFTSSAINTHNNLGGLQGGTVGEFYHLTAAQAGSIGSVIIQDAINNGVTNIAPSQNAVFDALAGKDDLGSAAAALAAANAYTDDVVPQAVLFCDAINGRVGVGTTSPLFQFHVEGSTAGLYLNRTGGSESFIAFAMAGTTTGQIRAISGGGLKFTNALGTTELVRVDSDGRLSGTALHNNAGSITGTTNQYIASGTYTPALTNVTNIDASTAFACQFIRVGNVVTVSGTVNIDTTAATTATELGISLPIASNFTSYIQCCGAATAQIADGSAVVQGDSTNDRASLRFSNAGTTDNRSWFFTFTYVIL